jgi:hypothetical protein
MDLNFLTPENQSSLTPHCSFRRHLPGWEFQRNEDCIDQPAQDAQAHGGGTRALPALFPASPGSPQTLSKWDPNRRKKAMHEMAL